MIFGQKKEIQSRCVINFENNINYHIHALTIKKKVLIVTEIIEIYNIYKLDIW